MLRPDSCHRGDGVTGVPTRPTLHDRLGRHTCVDEEGGHVGNLVQVSRHPATDNDDLRYVSLPQLMGVREARGQLKAGPRRQGFATEDHQGWLQAGLR